jgi:hypothetical protein
MNVVAAMPGHDRRCHQTGDRLRLGERFGFGRVAALQFSHGIDHPLPCSPSLGPVGSSNVKRRNRLLPSTQFVEEIGVTETF